MRDLMVLPEVSPYQSPALGRGRVPRQPQRVSSTSRSCESWPAEPGAPTLQIGAVEVLTRALRAVHRARSSAWSACWPRRRSRSSFAPSRSPAAASTGTVCSPRILPSTIWRTTDIDELWLIQINPSTCAQIPTETHEILDRRNSLAGNLSMEQELGFIETFNRAIAEGAINDPKIRADPRSRASRWIGNSLRGASSIDGPSCWGTAPVRRDEVPAISRASAGRESKQPGVGCQPRALTRAVHPRADAIGGNMHGHPSHRRRGLRARQGRDERRAWRETVDTSHEWIVARTGILERRLSGPEEAPSDMACQAALRCLSHAGVDKAAVDLIVVACATPDQSQPAVACMVQEKLGDRRASGPGVRRQLGLRRLRVRLERGAEHDAVGSRAVSQRTGHRHRRVLQDHELERSTNVHVLR